MIYLDRAIVRPFPDLIDFVAFDHAKWALVVNKIYGIRSGVSTLRIFRSFSVSILSESVTPRRQIDVGRIMLLWKDERLAQCPFGRSLLCFFAIGHAIRLVVSLHCGTKQFQCERLVHYCSIDKRSVGKGGGYDHGYVARRRIRFEPRCCLISRHRRHVEIHEN